VLGRRRDACPGSRRGARPGTPRRARAQLSDEATGVPRRRTSPNPSPPAARVTQRTGEQGHANPVTVHFSRDHAPMMRTSPGEGAGEGQCGWGRPSRQVRRRGRDGAIPNRSGCRAGLGGRLCKAPWSPRRWRRSRRAARDPARRRRVGHPPGPSLPTIPQVNRRSGRWGQRCGRGARDRRRSAWSLTREELIAHGPGAAQIRATGSARGPRGRASRRARADHSPRPRLRGPCPARTGSGLHEPGPEQAWYSYRSNAGGRHQLVDSLGGRSSFSSGS
jgi:hypothetical protein